MLLVKGMQPETTDTNAPGSAGVEPASGSPAAAALPMPAYKRWFFGGNPRKTLLRLCVCLVAVVILFNVLLVPMTVVGISMEPTYENGESNFINRWPYSLHPPRRGDVVAIQVAPKVLFLKRIVGLPGETVTVKRGRLRINGQRLVEPYAFSWIPGRWGRRLVPLSLEDFTLQPDEFFVIGDNRAVSVFGKVRGTQIVGKAVF